MHTHLSPREIAENKPLGNIWKAMVFDPDAGNCDHYIAQLMAGEDVPFAFTYGDAPDEQKWNEFARVFPDLRSTQIGPWTQLELNQTIGIEGLLSGTTKAKFWNDGNRRLEQPDMLPRALAADAFRIVATTDDPDSDLKYHEQINDPKTGLDECLVIPTFRPDTATQIHKPGWREHVNKLLEQTGKDATLDGLVAALKQRFEYFIEHGCLASDHGLTIPYGLEPNKNMAIQAFNEVHLHPDKQVSEKHKVEFISYMMDQFCSWARDAKTVAQIHIGVERNENSHIMDNFGANRGGDYAPHSVKIADNLKHLLSRYAGTGDREKDGKIVLYCANPSFYGTMAGLLRTFPGTSTGNAWWWWDSLEGMEQQHDAMAPSVSYGRWSGMACDARKLVSAKTRHETHARAVCNHLGKRVEAGTLHYDDAKIAVAKLCYGNAKTLFDPRKAEKRLNKYTLAK
jgi:glucuronate isomerase